MVSCPEVEDCDRDIEYFPDRTQNLVIVMLSCCAFKPDIFKLGKKSSNLVPSSPAPLHPLIQNRYSSGQLTMDS